MATLKWPGSNPVVLNQGGIQQAHGNFYPGGINAHPINRKAAHREVGCINKYLEAIQAEIHVNPVATNPNVGQGLTLRIEATVREERRDVCIAAL